MNNRKWIAEAIMTKESAKRVLKSTDGRNLALMLPEFKAFLDDVIKNCARSIKQTNEQTTVVRDVPMPQSG